MNMGVNMKNQYEAREQTKLFNLCRLTHKHEFLFHIPNGGSRNKIEARNLKLQGVKSGVPDLFYPVPNAKHHGLFIEMKYGKNKPTKNQIEWLDYLNSVGYLAVVCYSADEAFKLLEKYFKDKV
jgi:hypothetical protein